MGWEKGPCRAFWWLEWELLVSCCIGVCVCWGGGPRPTPWAHGHHSPWGGGGSLGLLLTTGCLHHCTSGGGHTKPLEETLHSLPSTPASQAVPLAPGLWGGCGWPRPAGPLFEPQPLGAAALCEKWGAREPVCVVPSLGPRNPSSSWVPVLVFFPAQESLRFGEVRFPRPNTALLLLGSLGPGKQGTVEMSPAGININKKQMDLHGGQLSINQTARPLTANTTQVGPCKTFSWPPSGRTSLPHPYPLPGSRSPSGHSGANSGWEGGAVPGAGDRAVSPALFGGTLPSGTPGSEGPSTHPCPTRWALPPPWVRGAVPSGTVLCSLFKYWQLPYCGQSLLKSLIGN